MGSGKGCPDMYHNCKNHTIDFYFKVFILACMFCNSLSICYMSVQVWPKLPITYTQGIGSTINQVPSPGCKWQPNSRMTGKCRKNHWHSVTGSPIFVNNFWNYSYLDSNFVFCRGHATAVSEVGRPDIYGRWHGPVWQSAASIHCQGDEDDIALCMDKEEWQERTHWTNYDDSGVICDGKGYNY